MNPATKTRLLMALSFALAIDPVTAQPGPAHRDARAPAPRYVVLDGVGRGDAYAGAVDLLVDRRAAIALPLNPDTLEPVRTALRQLLPEFVAIVLRPEQIDFELARRFLQMATEIDEDPFVDFSYGFVTGATGAQAVALLERSFTAERESRPLSIGELAVSGMRESVRSNAPLPLRRTRIPRLAGNLAGGDAGDHEHRDEAFLRAFLPDLAGHSALIFSGHGTPRHVVCGPDYSDLDDLDLYPAVVLNVACLTGVTHAWWEEDWRSRVLRRRTIPTAESFALAALRSGAIGYIAYVSDRPAGPELYTDLTAMLGDGAALGEARRRDYDKVVLGYLGYGDQRLHLAPLIDGAAIESARDAVRDIMLEAATGGVLFGDPAARPFARRPQDSPVAVEAENAGDHVLVHVHVDAHHLFYHCSDQTTVWKRQEMAMRIHHRLPLGDRSVKSVTVRDARRGAAPMPTRLVWAVEQDGGRGFVQLKALFPRDYRDDVELTFDVETTSDASQAQTLFAAPPLETPPPRAPTPAQREELTAQLCQRYRVSAKALAAARDATQAAIDGASTATRTLAELREFGSEGYRALCVCIETGVHNAFTWRLLQATWQRGDEDLLLELARRPPLPDYGSWAVLQGLGVSDTPAVRACLLERLETEEDPGLFMSAALGLALLRERAAVEPIVRRALRFENGWSGVEPQLLGALVQIQGKEATAHLRAYLGDERARAVDWVLPMLRDLDQEAAIEAARSLRARPGLSERGKTLVEELLR